MDYAEVLKKTWDITWRYKGLWVLGILASCGRGGGGGGGSNIVSTDNGELPSFIQEIPEEVLIPIVLGVVLIALLLALVFAVLGLMGQAGLIAGFNRVDSGSDATFGEAFRDGLSYFWRLLGLQILILVATFGLVILGILAAIPLGIITLGIGLLCLIPLVIIFAIAATIYLNLTRIALVVEDLDVFTALRRAWEVLRENLTPTVVMGLILLFGSFLAGLLIAAPLIAILIPIMTAILAGGEEALLAGIGFGALCFVVYLPILILLNGILSSYITGAWTLTYRRLTGKAGELAPGLSPG